MEKDEMARWAGKCKNLKTRKHVRLKDALVRMDIMKFVVVTTLDKTACDAYMKKNPFTGVLISP